MLLLCCCSGSRGAVVDVNVAVVVFAVFVVVACMDTCVHHTTFTPHLAFSLTGQGGPVGLKNVVVTTDQAITALIACRRE